MCVCVCSDSDVEEQSAPYDYRNHYEIQHKEKELLKNRVDDIKNRIELRHMLSEYLSGSLKPPIFYKNGIFAPNDLATNDDGIDAIESIFDKQPQQSKHLLRPSQDNNLFSNNENIDDYPSPFREHYRPKYIVENIREFDEFDDRNNNNPNEYQQQMLKENQPKEQSAVYTEGGLVYGPSTLAVTMQHQNRKF